MMYMIRRPHVCRAHVATAVLKITAHSAVTPQFIQSACSSLSDLSRSSMDLDVTQRSVTCSIYCRLHGVKE